MTKKRRCSRCSPSNRATCSRCCRKPSCWSIAANRRRPPACTPTRCRSSRPTRGCPACCAIRSRAPSRRFAGTMRRSPRTWRRALREVRASHDDAGARSRRTWARGIARQTAHLSPAADFPARAEAADTRVLSRARRFPWLAEFEAATAQIRAECEQVLREDTAALVPYISSPTACLSINGRSSTSREGGAHFFCGATASAWMRHADRCPQTAALLAAAPCADVPGYAPTAFFSILDRKSHIPPHTGVTNSRLIVHLPLVVPPGCRFRVGSETREWREGQSLGVRRHDRARGMERK